MLRVVRGCWARVCNAVFSSVFGSDDLSTNARKRKWAESLGAAFARTIAILLLGAGLFVAYLLWSSRQPLAAPTAVLDANGAPQQIDLGERKGLAAWRTEVMARLDYGARLPDSQLLSEFDAGFALSETACLPFPVDIIPNAAFKLLERRNAELLMARPELELVCPQDSGIHVCMMTLRVGRQFVHAYHVSVEKTVGSGFVLNGQSIMFAAADDPRSQARGFYRGIYTGPRYADITLAYSLRTALDAEPQRLRLTGLAAVAAVDCMDLQQGAVGSLLEQHVIDPPSPPPPPSSPSPSPSPPPPSLSHPAESSGRSLPAEPASEPAAAPDSAGLPAARPATRDFARVPPEFAQEPLGTDPPGPSRPSADEAPPATRRSP